MTAGTVLVVLGALSLVLALIALGVRLTKGVRSAPGPQLSMRVVGRVALGPRQGLATVRVGERLLVVSVGEGGVHPVCELDDEDAPALAADSAEPASVALTTPIPGGRLVEALRGGAVPVPAAVARSRWGRMTSGARTALLALVLAASAAAGTALPARAEAAAGPRTAALQTVAMQTPAAAPQQPGVGAASGRARGDAVSALGGALPEMSLQVGDEEGLQLSGTVGTVLVIGLLTMLPTLLLLMTSFTRVLVVLHFLRQALGTQTAPPAQMIAALALLLTGFVMAPTLGRVNETAIQPWMDGQMDEAAMMGTAAGPFRDFMAEHVRESDLATFIDMSEGPAPETIDDVPLITLVSAFAISELRTAFQIGFVLFLPFLVIDLVVAAVLMSLGMFMLPPVMVSLPFKLLLFVLVDGWALVVHSVVASFG